MSWKIIAGALAIMGALGTLWVAYEVRTGIAQSRGATVVRSEDPQGFWILTAINAVVIGIFFFGAFKAWRQGQRDPNF
jgi:hypothetical protein